MGVETEGLLRKRQGGPSGLACVVAGLAICALAALAGVVSYGAPGESMMSAPGGAPAPAGSGLVDCDAAYGVLSSLFCSSPKAGKTTSAPHQAAIAVAAEGAHTQQKWTRLPPPKDCSCCKANCAQAGAIHAKVDGKATTTKYWCQKPSRYTWHFQCATVYDYNCICCDIVRGLYKGQKCA